MTVLSSNPTVEEIAAASVRCTDSRLFEVWRSEPYGPSGYRRQFVAYIRWDDSCKNGHNSFFSRVISVLEGAKVTERNLYASKDSAASVGALPLVPAHIAALARWNNCSSDGPMYYLANTCYLAGDRDCHGLRKGERRQIVNGRTKEPCWRLAFVDEHDGVLNEAPPSYVEGATPPAAPRAMYVPWERIGEGKARELDAARRVAIWPEATDEELTAPDLREKLIARLPGLLVQFRAELETYGIPW